MVIWGMVYYCCTHIRYKSHTLAAQEMASLEQKHCLFSIIVHLLTVSDESRYVSIRLNCIVVVPCVTSSLVTQFDIHIYERTITTLLSEFVVQVHALHIH